MGEHRVFVIENFNYNGGSQILTQQAFCIRHMALKMKPPRPTFDHNNTGKCGA